MFTEKLIICSPRFYGPRKLIVLFRKGVTRRAPQSI